MTRCSRGRKHRQFVVLESLIIVPVMYRKVELAIKAIAGYMIDQIGSMYDAVSIRATSTLDLQKSVSEKRLKLRVIFKRCKKNRLALNDP